MDERNKLINVIGEKKLLQVLFNNHLTPNSNFLNGFNQDAGIINITDDILLVSNIDKAQTPVILSDDDSSTFKTWGFLSVTSSLSDVVVVGAKGKSYLMSLTLPYDLKADKVLKIIEGAQNACDYYGITYLGGDTKKGEEISVVGTANGIITDSIFLTRNGSRPSDLIVCTGEFGEFATSYFKLLNSIPLKSVELDYLLQPKFDKHAADGVNRNINLFSASMDNSDGLNNILTKMFSENDLGCRIFIDSLPFSESSRKLSIDFNIPIENFAFYVGDWNSIYTISRENFDLFCKFEPLNGLKVIGEVTKHNRDKLFCMNNKSFLSSIDFQNDSFKSTTNDKDYFLENLMSSESILI